MITNLKITLVVSLSVLLLFIKWYFPSQQTQQNALKEIHTYSAGPGFRFTLKITPNTIEYDDELDMGKKPISKKLQNHEFESLQKLYKELQLWEFTGDQTDRSSENELAVSLPTYLYLFLQDGSNLKIICEVRCVEPVKSFEQSINKLRANYFD
ncbi:MAG: hypothetical protein O2871_01600 [bacterium]|nr:hypothetical protein [bacterium]